MKTITATELQNILASHKLWIETKGKQGVCAELGGAHLENANLYNADLRCANLYNADLRGANLTGANLEGAILYNASLNGAILYFTNLRFTNLRDADLRDADLTGANLLDTNLRFTNLTNTVLDEKKKEETKMNMENENGFILSSEEKDMVLEYRKKTAKEKKIKEISAFQHEAKMTLVNHLFSVNAKGVVSEVAAIALESATRSWLARERLRTRRPK